MLIAFSVSLLAVVLAEMGDKTQLLAMAFAAKYRWQTVLWAVFWATLLNHLLAVAAGSAIAGIVPMEWIKLAAALSFILFALWTIRGDKLDDDGGRTLRSPFWTVAIAFFIAEMGDKTQLMTIALAADQAVKASGEGWAAAAIQAISVWMGTTCGMIVADAAGIVVGIVMHKHIPENVVKWVAAGCFAAFGMLGLHEALDVLLAPGSSYHHILLLVGAAVVGLGMWALSSKSPGK